MYRKPTPACTHSSTHTTQLKLTNKQTCKQSDRQTDIQTNRYSFKYKYQYKWISVLPLCLQLLVYFVFFVRNIKPNWYAVRFTIIFVPWSWRSLNWLKKFFWEWDLLVFNYNFYSPCLPICLVLVKYFHLIHFFESNVPFFQFLFCLSGFICYVLEINFCSFGLLVLSPLEDLPILI